MASHAIDVEKINSLVKINVRLNANCADGDALLVYILESAMRLVHCESSSLLLRVDEKKLKFYVALGPKGGEALSIPVDVKGSIAGWVLENNQSITIDDAQTDPRFFVGVQDKTGYKTTTMLAVPLRVKNKCIGVIELLNKVDGQIFNQSDLDILELLSIQAGLAYQNGNVHQQAQNKIYDLKSTMATSFGVHDFIGISPSIVDLLKVIDQIARTNASVLILGESGVGKELVAERIYSKSARADFPFVGVNCAALSPQLLESELFGHVGGAFIDAVANRSGRFEVADGGTLFLDEIAELPLDLQAKLLRVIQSRTFEKVGSSDTVSIDVRIIAATNRDLEEMVKLGTFRSDLFFRLNVFPIQVPSLRVRQEDIEPLAEFFVKKFSIKTNKYFTGFSDDAINMLKSYSWPGNVRELENSVERACVLGTPPIIYEQDLGLNVGKQNDQQQIAFDFLSGDKTLKTALYGFKKNYIIRILEETGWNQTEAAKVLNVQRTYVSRLINELNIR